MTFPLRFWVLQVAGRAATRSDAGSSPPERLLMVPCREYCASAFFLRKAHWRLTTVTELALLYLSPCCVLFTFWGLSSFTCIPPIPSPPRRSHALLKIRIVSLIYSITSIWLLSGDFHILRFIPYPYNPNSCRAYDRLEFRI